MPQATEIRKIDGDAGRALYGSGAADQAIVDRRGGATVVLNNQGPDALLVYAVTITGGAGASTTYTLGAPTSIAVGSSHTVTGLTRMGSAGRCRVRIVET